MLHLTLTSCRGVGGAREGSKKQGEPFVGAVDCCVERVVSFRVLAARPYAAFLYCFSTSPNYISVLLRS